jgi:hypothetical protein
MDFNALIEATNWDNLLGSLEFWESYYELGENDDYLLRYYDIDLLEMNDVNIGERPTTSLRFELPSRYAVSIEMLISGGYNRLVVHCPSDADDAQLEKIILGWDGPHAIPNALRWEELEAIVSCISRYGQTPCNPAFIPLLLFKFTLLTKDIERSAHMKLKEYALEAQPFVSGDLMSLIRDLTSLMTYWETDNRGPVWFHDEERGWVVLGTPGYSQRSSILYHRGSDEPSDEEHIDLAAIRNFMRMVYDCAGVSGLM